MEQIRNMHLKASLGKEGIVFAIRIANLSVHHAPHSQRKRIQLC